MGVSGGGGEPLVARVVDVEAVDKYRFMEVGVGVARLVLLGSPLGIGSSEIGAGWPCL
jgi:hypothetical protein